MLHSSAIATIPDDGDTSNVIDLAGYDIVGFVADDSFDGTSITFEVSTSKDGAFVALEHEVSDGEGGVVNAALSVTLDGGEAVRVTPPFIGFRFVKLVSSGNQTTSDTNIIVALRSL